MMHLAPTADLSGDRFRMARPAAQLRLGYLVSQYPAVSHTFIYREIVALRKSGATILTSSVNLPDRPANQLPECERVEADGVFYIKATPALRIGAAIIRTLFSRPRGFFAGLATAFNHGFSNPSEFFRWCGYFGEAVIVGDRLRSQGFHRLHVHFATEV
ncbi:MAG TPA: hypothetical protein VG273_12135, partial [Bryobacteraceae bacterium]|nr:hypothetical protein [Bryobacteraceae bacterium]